MRQARSFCWCVIAIVFAGCASFKEQPVSFKMPAAYPNATQVAGATIGAQAYDDAGQAQKAFGWNIRSAGLLPVQIVFDNLGEHSLEIEPMQTFLIDGEDNLWAILESKLAYERVSSKTDLARIAGKSVKPGLLGGAAGALVGAAIGIVSGTNVGSAAGKGAALGAALGATAGGVKAATSEGEARAMISDDLESKSLENKAVRPKTIAHGFIFFPGEAKGVKELRLQIRVVETGALHAVRLSL